MGPVAALLADGHRLHLQHGPIDLIIGADRERAVAFAAAQQRFSSILDELVEELPVLRCQSPGQPRGRAACRMQAAIAPHRGQAFLTPMAAVAGAVADEILAAMVASAPLRRAYVNNGGDIALHLRPGTRYRSAICGTDGAGLGRIDVGSSDGVGGIATSGCNGRSLSMGIADSVTVLAGNAAAADAAATLIANAVDLPGHPAIRRAPAQSLAPDSDLGTRPVTTGVGALNAGEVGTALSRGLSEARRMQNLGLIHGAALFLRGQSLITGSRDLLKTEPTEALNHA